MFTLADPVKNPFNDWLKANSIWVALGVVAVLLLTVGLILILSKTKKH